MDMRPPTWHTNPMSVRWLTLFFDRPASSFDPAVQFWSAVTASTLSPSRGDHGEFATLLPPDGDPYLRVQRVRAGAGGSHLDVHVDEIAGFARRAVEAGAHKQYGHGDVVVLRSPAGLQWCVVGHHGEQQRPAPQPAGATGSLHLVDQLCIDVPAPRFDDECAFWAEVTGWQLHHSSLHEEFRYLTRPWGCPLRLLLQRIDDETGDARAHVDLAASDVHTVVGHHVDLGASVVAAFEHWTVLADPAGVRYCVTARDPASGAIPASL